MTEELLRVTPPPGLSLIIDDGVSVDPALYLQRREEMLAHYFFGDRDAYAQECLVANLSRHHFTERFMVSEKKGVERLAQTGTGEADVKIPRFIMYGNKTSRYLVVSQDTDLIFILLLHMKSLLPFEENLEVWLDTQTPSDRKNGGSRVYRYINVKELYNAIVDLFDREYPSIQNPIETFVFLVYALETDFTSDFDPVLRITPELVWNTFSALHTCPEVLQSTGYLLFNGHMYDEVAAVGTKREEHRDREMAKMGVKRSEDRVCPYPSKWVGVLSSAVMYGYNALSDEYNIVLEDVKVQSFLYFLCQFKVLDELTSLGYTQFDRKKKKANHCTYIPTKDEIFYWTGEIEAKLEAHRLSLLNTAREEEDRKRKAIDELVTRATTQKPSFNLVSHKHFKKTPASSSSSSNEISKIIDEIEEIEEDEVPVPVPVAVVVPLSNSATVRKRMNELIKKEIPKDYGVPHLHAMLARIYRTQWVMNYHQNGWKTTDYATNFAEPHPGDATLSCHGWKAREIVQDEESVARGDYNNSYYTSVFVEGIEPGVIPFRLYEMVETDLIFNRHHTAYLDFGVQ